MVNSKTQRVEGPGESLTIFTASFSQISQLVAYAGDFGLHWVSSVMLSRPFVGAWLFTWMGPVIFFPTKQRVYTWKRLEGRSSSFSCATWQVDTHKLRWSETLSTDGSTMKATCFFCLEAAFQRNVQVDVTRICFSWDLCSSSEWVDRGLPFNPGN